METENLKKPIDGEPPAPRVKRLLRCRKTRHYYTGDGWSREPQKAKTFANELDAVREYVNKRSSDQAMRDVELVLRFSESNCDLFATPLPRAE